MTAPVFWARIGPHLTGRVTETDVPISGTSIAKNEYQLPTPAGQLWERVAEQTKAHS